MDKMIYNNVNRVNNTQCVLKGIRVYRKYSAAESS